MRKIKKYIALFIINHFLCGNHFFLLKRVLLRFTNARIGKDVKYIIVNEAGLTSRECVYAGGDAVTGAATVISAMGAGKLGAKSIHEYLSKK